MTYKNILLLLFFITAKSTPSHAFIDISQILSKMKAAHNIDVLHYDIQAKIITKEKTAKFTTKVTFSSKEDSLAKVIFYLGMIFNIESIERENVSLKFGVASQGIFFSRTVRVFLDTPLKKDEKVTLTFRYSLKSEDVEYTFMSLREDFCDFDGLSGWFPSVYPEDTFTQEVHITVPREQTTITGALLKETIEDKGFKTFVFNTDEPILGNFLIIGLFTKFEKTYKGIPIEIYSYEKKEEFYKNVLKDIQFTLDQYQQWFGKYPVKNYILAILPTSKGPSMCLLYAVKIDLKVIELASIGAISHETAHKWLGNSIYPKFITPYGFLTEGLAEYSSLLIRIKKFGMAEMKKEYDVVTEVLKNRDVPISEVKALYGSEWGIFYFKSPFIYRMLHWIVGDEKFFKILKTYAQRYYHKWPEIKDFQSAAEEVYGKKLDWFFDPWLNTTKKLDLMVENVNVTQEKKNYNYSFTLKNIGDVNMPVDVEIELKGSKKEEIKKVSFSGTTQEVTLKTTFPATELLIDPHYWLFDFDRTNNTFKLTQ